MTEVQERGINKFLNLHYGNLEVGTTRMGYKTLKIKDTDRKIFITEETNNLIYVDTNYVIHPILSMFRTDYTETYDYVKNWLLKKYGLDCLDIVGSTMNL